MPMPTEGHVTECGHRNSPNDLADPSKPVLSERWLAQLSSGGLAGSSARSSNWPLCGGWNKALTGINQLWVSFLVGSDCFELSCASRTARIRAASLRFPKAPATGRVTGVEFKP